MATYVKYEVFVGDLMNKTHDLLGTTPGSDCDTLKVMLSNTAPNAATHTVRSEAGEITGGNGYTSGGSVIGGQSGARSGGTVTLSGNAVTWTAETDTMATFRYVILYNDTPTSPADPLIASWDYGSAVSLAVGESFTVKFNNADSGGTIFTLA
jgi:hypothetical protein